MRRRGQPLGAPALIAALAIGGGLAVGGCGSGGSSGSPGKGGGGTSSRATTTPAAAGTHTHTVSLATLIREAQAPPKPVPKHPPKLPTGCLPTAIAAFAHATGVPVAAVSRHYGPGAGQQPQCTLRAGQASMAINIDSQAQPLFRLERTEVEQTQHFSPGQWHNAVPQPVAHLGLDAWWLPQLAQLQTSDGWRLISVTIHWKGHSLAQRIALTSAEARLYLGPDGPSNY